MVQDHPDQQGVEADWLEDQEIEASELLQQSREPANQPATVYSASKLFQATCENGSQLGSGE